MKLNIRCGLLDGVLHVAFEGETDGPNRPYVLDFLGNEYTPSAFEARAGYRSKKWRWSFKVCEDGKTPTRYCEWTRRFSRRERRKTKERTVVEVNEGGDDAFSMRFPAVCCPKCSNATTSATPTSDWIFTCERKGCGHLFFKPYVC